MSVEARESEDARGGAAPPLRLFAVDDSKMILTIYRGILHKPFTAEELGTALRDLGKMR